MSFSPDAWKRIGVLFQAGRHVTGMSAETFADHAGISVKAVYNAESGAEHRGVPPTFAKFAAALGWTPESVRAVLDGGNPVTANGSETSDSPAPAPTPPSATREPTLLDLLMEVDEFGRLAVSLGGDEALRNELDRTAKRLVRSIPHRATVQDGRRHWATASEDPADADGERILRAMERGE